MNERPAYPEPDPATGLYSEPHFASVTLDYGDGVKRYWPMTKFMAIGVQAIMEQNGYGEGHPLVKAGHNEFVHQIYNICSEGLRLKGGVDSEAHTLLDIISLLYRKHGQSIDE